MNTKNLLAAVMLLFSVLYSSQNGGIGINTSSPQGALDVVSSTGSFIPPRMTTPQRDALVSPPAGAVIYNTTNAVLEFNYGTPAAPLWKTPVTTTVASSYIVLAGGTSDAVSATFGDGTNNGAGYFQFTVTLPSASKCKFDLYPSVWSSAATGLGTRLFIDNLTTPVASVGTAAASASDIHSIVPYSYVTSTALGAGGHTIRVQAGTTSKIDTNDRITYSYLCWN
ncbi:hypothetical protein [uncultured Chryseobacterium sp.]|uniref:hypothetical protein n=1 Tax=uncultured Chryseobacterium sp. TaxID=259322 RepID=UPI00258B18E4|nr:hypothetical protein [uncultured Chryseobacterium sp.]